MSKGIIAIVGSYRKGGIIDQTVDVVLGVLQKKGVPAEKVYLLDRHIEFCTNCRSCTQAEGGVRRGRCILNDDMDGLLAKIDASDGIVLASPINFSTTTAVMKRFIERCLVYTYWPWGTIAPKPRVRQRNKKAVVVVASSCPGLLGRFLMPSAAALLKTTAGLMGARVVSSLHFGGVCNEREQKLSARQHRLAQSAAFLL